MAQSLTKGFVQLIDLLVKNPQCTWVFGIFDRVNISTNHLGFVTLNTMTINPQTKPLISTQLDLRQQATIVSGWRMRLVKIRLRSHLLFLLFKKCGTLSDARSSFKKLLALRKVSMGNIKLVKYTKIGKQYSWAMYAPPFPSKELDRLLNKEIDFALSDGSGANPLHFIFLSITKKCPLNCEHCFEWDIMHRPEQLSLEDLKKIVNGFLDKGISSIFLSGGEPLSRYNDLLKLVEYASPSCKTWLFSSGYTLDETKAYALKQAGLTGAVISIDHFEEEAHNAFRRNPQSFERAIIAVKSVKVAGLVPALSICVTKEFLSKENLMNYMEFAKGLGVVFVQFMEPKAEGRYKELDVALNENQLTLLSDFFRNFNEDEEKADYPTIIYQGYHQRKVGCHGGGKRFLYVDSDGNIQACPFCPNKMGNALQKPLQYNGGSCKQFEPSTV